MRFSTDTTKGVKNISLQSVECLLDHKTLNAKTICVEMVESATPLHHFKHPDNAYYIFGPEDGSIDQ